MAHYKVRVLLSLACLALPSSLRIAVMRRFFGYRIAKNCHIGLSLVLCESVTMGAGANIGHFTVIKGLERLEMGESSSIGQFNWISGFRRNPKRPPSFAKEQDRKSILIIGFHAALTNRHIVDCTNAVSIGPFSTIAGYRSQILTHGIEIETSTQSSAPVSIGAYAIVGSGCLLLKGTSLPDRCVLGAGSVLTKKLSDQNALYAGAPARKIKDISSDAKYFQREIGYVA